MLAIWWREVQWRWIHEYNPRHHPPLEHFYHPQTKLSAHPQHLVTTVPPSILMSFTIPRSAHKWNHAVCLPVSGFCDSQCPSSCLATSTRQHGSSLHHWFFPVPGIEARDDLLGYIPSLSILFWDRVLLSHPGWPRTSDSPASGSHTWLNSITFLHSTVCIYKMCLFIHQRTVVLIPPFGCCE